MSGVQIVKVDEGGVNARILAKETKADFRRVETASLKIRARFTSAEGKRFFVRRFSTLQLNAHFISVIARTRLSHDDVAKVEAALRKSVDAVNQQLNKAIDGAEALFKLHGVTSVATYDTVPLEVDVGVISSLGRRYLEVLEKFDQFMPLLQTLEIHEILSGQEVDNQRAALKRQVRDIAQAVRTFATAMRRRMNAMTARGAVGAPSAAAGADTPAAAKHHDASDAVESTQPDGSATVAAEQATAIAEMD